MRSIHIIIYFFITITIASCQTNSSKKTDILPGIHNINNFKNKLKYKNIAVVANHSAIINNVHLVDTLISLGINVKTIFSPEHGFRGNKDAGAAINNDVDNKTGLKVISLYGKNKKPQNSDLQDIDIIIFDIQDVGVRFYTYLSTMHYIMEAAAENNIKVIVLDRPNPNGFYVDGPVLDTTQKSFVGMHPIPIVHGMTLGELAQMINGEKWLKNGIRCDIEILKCENYSHNDLYQLPIKPSPNLPNMTSIYLYPSLALFEGTVMSVGRGTQMPFQIYGHPNNKSKFSFTPISTPGASNNPKYKGTICYGEDLRNFDINTFKNKPELSLKYIIEAYNNINSKDIFFNNFFYNLSGNKKLKNQIINNISEKDIKLSWEKELKQFKEKRKKYLLYPDFE